MQWDIAMRNGDTDMAERKRQIRLMPEVLIITPESLMLLLAQKNYPSFFKNLHIIAVDEWHELLGSKRGVQVELAISRILNIKNEAQELQAEKSLNHNTAQNKKNNTQRSHKNSGEEKTLRPPVVWGISATIGNLEEAMEVLLASWIKKNNGGKNIPAATQFRQTLTKDGGVAIVKARMEKHIEMIPVIPDEIEKYPWAGHLGIKLAEKIVPIIEQSSTTLVFINTRSMSELWYQTLLTVAPQLAGVIALHHGSIEHELRIWVEEALHAQKLKAVVCTASLDLGVDFRPVDTVIQVGSPKGVSRFLQRAGRSGHKPGDISKVYFLPTHSLELVEAAGLKNAIHQNVIESKQPLLLCFDVLMQFVCTLAIGEGFYAEDIFEEIKTTFCFHDITRQEWNELLLQITNGGKALSGYDEYKKVEVDETGLHRIKNRRIAMRHRMQIGTIVSDVMMKIKMMSGGYIGMIEEWFISRLEPGDSFTFAGRILELVMIKEMTAYVRKSNKKKSIIPSWMGSRMSLTANLGMVLRRTFNAAFTSDLAELKVLKPLFKLQEELSHIPLSDELLIEQIEAEDGFHLLVYPFEGRQIHEAMSSILAYRISRIMPITFSISMNDYGFELLSDQPIPVDDSNVHELFTTNNLIADIQRSVNAVEMAQRKFRDIAVIGGLIFTGYPGEPKKAQHLQASASLLFKVFSEYDSKNILLRQAYQEVFEQQMEEVRLRTALERICNNEIILKFPKRFTPLSFPIIVDSLSRYNLSSEKFEDRVRKMQKQLEAK
jgi:ATP-dependent Lhr-like helicase